MAIAAACASVSMLLTARAEAACTPAAGNDVSAVCTGATAGGYGGAGFTNLNVTVDTGATVTAGAASITFNTGSLLNRGTVSGVTSGVLGATATITNSALIFASGGTAIDLSGSLTLTNSGSVQGSQNGVHAATATIANSGLIVGTSGPGDQPERLWRHHQQRQHFRQLRHSLVFHRQAREPRIGVWRQCRLVGERRDDRQ
ncbi:hypothetical protein [Bradyrhizobium ottawaense]|uniref:hypothetical protein n=1 Tax=Bradyrhizobium ottawaense TaxID=931866 RepID=UPI0033943516